MEECMIKEQKTVQNCVGISTWNEEVLKSMFASHVPHTLTLCT